MIVADTNLIVYLLLEGEHTAQARRRKFKHESSAVIQKSPEGTK